MSVFNWAELTTLRNGLTRQPPHKQVESRRRVPYTLSMVLYVFNRYSRHRLLSMRVNAIAVVLGFCCLLRPSEYTMGTKTNAHVLRASALEFECSNGPGQQSTLIGSHLVHTVEWSRILLVRIYMSTAKNFRVGRALWFSAGSTTDTLHIVRVLYDWVCATRPQPSNFIAPPKPSASHLIISVSKLSVSVAPLYCGQAEPQTARSFLWVVGNRCQRASATRRCPLTPTTECSRCCFTRANTPHATSVYRTAFPHCTTLLQQQPSLTPTPTTAMCNSIRREGSILPSYILVHRSVLSIRVTYAQFYTLPAHLGP
jgi:hypothetical protein